MLAFFRELKVESKKKLIKAVGDVGAGGEKVALIASLWCDVHIDCSFQYVYDNLFFKLARDSGTGNFSLYGGDEFAMYLLPLPHPAPGERSHSHY